MFLPWQMLVFVVGGALVAGLLIRRVNARTAWELILGGTLFLGAWFYLWVACSGEIGLLAASLLVLLQALVRRVWTHDLFILIGVSGVALNFAFLFPAHTILIPFWAEQLGKTTLYAEQLSKRGGKLHCILQGDRVLMTGTAVTYLKGTIAV